MTNTLLTTKSLSKTYIMGDIQVHALRHVNLEVQKGDFIAIMGASGSGKTTFMNLLGCLDKPSEGEYILDDIPVHQMNEDDLTVIRNQRSAMCSRASTCYPEPPPSKT
jgi:putative ABC transport system ATP-binding protein